MYDQMFCLSYLKFCGEGHIGFLLLWFDPTDLLQCLLKFGGHDEIQKEVCRTVDEGHHVHHLPHRVVALKEELLAKDG